MIHIATYSAIMATAPLIYTIGKDIAEKCKEKKRNHRRASIARGEKNENRTEEETSRFHTLRNTRRPLQKSRKKFSTGVDKAI